MSVWLDEARKWAEQAEFEFSQAEDMLDRGVYSYACFLAQQAAEKIVKAVHYCKGEEKRGHVIRTLLLGLEKGYHVNVRDLLPLAGELDKHYAAPRYPNVHRGEKKPPFKLYTQEMAEKCIEGARRILERMKTELT